MGDQLGQLAACEPEVVFLYEGGEVAEELRSKLTHVRVGPQVIEIPNWTFHGCKKLVEVELNEGLTRGCWLLVKTHLHAARHYEA